MMEASSSGIAPLLLKNLFTTFFFLADKSLIFLGEKSKLLGAVRYLLISSFLFFLRLLPSLFPNVNPSEEDYKSYSSSLNPTRHGENYVPAAVGGGGPGGAGTGTAFDSGIERALSQLLAIVNDIPVSSRKYEVVRSLAERLIDDNLSERNEALREINIAVLSAAFARTLSQLEAVMVDQGRGGFGGDVINSTRDGGDYVKSLNRLVRVVRYCGDVVRQRGRSRDELSRSGSSAEKLAAELLWLAQKTEDCGSADEAVHKWASASNLAWLSLTAEPRLQGSLVKISAFLFKQARVLGKERNEECTKEQQRQTKVKILLLWIPLLCRASMGTDIPVLSVTERTELEKILEDIIEGLEQPEDQEKVLSLWLHHFTYCPSSDWPNLHGCYTRWCMQSRRKMLRTKWTK